MKQLIERDLVHLPSHQMKNVAEALLSYRPTTRTDAKQSIVQFAARGFKENEIAWEAVNKARDGLTKLVVGGPAVDEAALTKRVLEHVTQLIDSARDDHAKAMTKGVLEEIRKELLKYRPVEIITGGKSKKLKARQHIAFERVVQLASQRVNVLMTGPAGCGKTYLGAQVAEALGMDFSSISCSVGMSESQLAGWLLPTGKGGTFEYQPAPFINMYEKGGVFLLDEIDAGDANTLTFTNKALANAGFYIPQRLKKPYVQKHADFVALAAANTFGTGANAQYVGRNQLDAATLDRFKAGTVVLDYDTTLEQELIHPEVLEWGWRIRELIKRNGLRKIMSTRVMLDFTKMTEAYKWGKEQWEAAYFAEWSEDERRRAAA